MAKELFKVYYSREICGHGYVWAERYDEAYDIICVLNEDPGNLVYQDGFRSGFAVEHVPEEDPTKVPVYEILNPEDKEGGSV